MEGEECRRVEGFVGSENGKEEGLELVVEGKKG